MVRLSFYISFHSLSTGISANALNAIENAWARQKRHKPRLMDPIADGGELKPARRELKAGEEMAIGHPGEGTIITRTITKQETG